MHQERDDAVCALFKRCRAFAFECSISDLERSLKKHKVLKKVHKPSPRITSSPFFEQCYSPSTHESSICTSENYKESESSDEKRNSALVS